jgi:hypothetical protein
LSREYEAIINMMNWHITEKRQEQAVHCHLERIMIPATHPEN